ncbi:MAG TPA: type II secretion system protein M [Steroidobacteraceae bacterium]|jgi:type II secretory pathway component PulM
MIERLSQYLQRLEPRERRFVLIGALAVLLLIVVGTLLPLQRSVAATSSRVERKRDDLQWLRSMAPQLAGLQGNQRPALRESLVVLVDRTARESGLAKSVVGSQPSGDGGLSVRLDQTAFDALVAWLSQLRERYGVIVDSATIDSGKGNGTVTATLVLHAG